MNTGKDPDIACSIFVKEELNIKYKNATNKNRRKVRGNAGRIGKLLVAFSIDLIYNFQKWYYMHDAGKLRASTCGALLV